MSAKQIAFNHAARTAMKRGISQLAHAVRTTLGPRGRSVIIRKEYGPPLVINDGATVAREIDVEDKFENLGVKIAREAATKTNDIAGDGTTTSTVLAEAIYSEGLKLLEGGVNRMLLKRGMDRAVTDVLQTLQEMSTPIKSRTETAQVATVSANFDTEIGEKIADARESVGRDGIILIEEGKSLTTSIEVVQGIQFDRGYISPYFVTDASHMQANLDDCYVLIYERKLSQVREFLPLLEKVSRAGKPLLVIAEDVESDVLATLVINTLRGTLKCCAVKAPGYGDRRKAMLQDIAILTGGEAIFKDLGTLLENVELTQLGRAKRVEVEKDATTIIEGAGNTDAIQARVKQLRRELETTKSSYDREKLEERLGKLTGGIAKLIVGAATESEMKEKKARVEDAVHATRAALEEGIVPGGGVALIRAAARLETKDASSASGSRAAGTNGQSQHEVQAGYNVILRACRAPLYWIAVNAGMSGSVVVNDVREQTGNVGCDVRTRQMVDMIAAGIIDPTKVVRTALSNAASVATLLLTSDALITEKPKHTHRHRGSRYESDEDLY